MSEPQWAISIVGEGEIDPRTVVLHPQNPKVHPPTQDQVVGASLRRWGWLHKPIINKRTGHLLDGEDRIKLAIAHGQTRVPFAYVDVPAEDEGAVLMTLDQSAALAEVHLERWAALYHETAIDEPALLAMWAQQASDYGLEVRGQAAQPPAAVVEADVDVDAERLDAIRARWPVTPGALWACGRHRLLCGDARDPAALARLLDGAVPTLVVADPPYGVSIVQTNGYVGGDEAYAIPFGGVQHDPQRGYVGGGQAIKDRTGHYPIETWGTRDKRKRVSGGTRVKARTGHYPIEGRGQVGHHAPRSAPVGKYAPVLGDESPETARQAATYFLTTYPRAVQVWWGANYYTEVLPGASCWLVWDKETTGNFADCELAWTNHGGAVRQFTHRWNGMLRASERERRWHPTQKPAALMAWVYDVVGNQDDIILDPFLGSGPTLIAAEQRDRTVYGTDLSPDYISIACERWHVLTGETPQRVP